MLATSCFSRTLTVLALYAFVCSEAATLISKTYTGECFFIGDNDGALLVVSMALDSSGFSLKVAQQLTTFQSTRRAAYFSTDAPMDTRTPTSVQVSSQMAP